MASVLKSDAVDQTNAAARRVSGLAGFNLDDLANQGRARLDECRAEIQRLMADANKQAEVIAAKAKEEGYQEGLRQASVDADKKLRLEAERRAKDGLAVISTAVKRLHETHQQWMQTYAQTMTSIALAAAEKIVRRRLEQEPELLVTWASEALHSTRSAMRLTLAVHPETIAELGEALDQALASPDLPEQTHVEPDESLDPGDVVVRQAGGDINAGLNAQLDRLREMLS